MKEYKVHFSMTIEGTVFVEAEDGEHAQGLVSKDPDLTMVEYPDSCEIVDWHVGLRKE